MADATYKRHDTYPPLQATLLSGGSPIDLTTATAVEIILKGKTVLVTGACVISVPKTNGIVTYNWSAGDLAVSDTYSVEFQITWASGGIETVPNGAYNSILVLDDLDNA